jgi:hypothetical protein
MTRKLLVLFIPLLFLTNVAAAKAETTVSPNVRTTTINATTAAGTNPMTAKILMDQKKTAITKIRDDMKTMIQAKRAEFNTKLQTIKDQNKKALVERINSRLVEINKNQTTRYADILSQLQSFLDKISTSATPTASLANITNAQNIINIAKSAVSAQSEKAYIMTITDGTTLRQNAGIVVSQFRQDITSVYRLVLEAKLAVLSLKPIVKPLVSPIIMKPMIKKFATGSAK